MIKSEYGHYSLEKNGRNVVLWDVDKKEMGNLANFFVSDILKEIGTTSGPQVILNAAQREWNQITDTQIRELKSQVEKLVNESYKQQDVDDLDCKVARLATVSDNNQTRIREINDLLRSGKEVTVHSRLSDMEENLNELCSRVPKNVMGGNLLWIQGTNNKIADLEKIVKVMSKALDDLKQDHSKHYEAHETSMRNVEERLSIKFSREIQALKESNEQRKKDIKHAWNACEETQKEMAMHRANTKSIGEALNTHMIKCQGGECDRARMSVCSVKLDKMEECCKNTVAAGKELEKKVDFVAASIRNHDARLSGHKEAIDELTKRSCRAQKFMDKLHDL